jgi:N-acetylglucosamine kinase-like BadF-type ATPase
MYVVGIDGGASKTVAILGSADGRVLGRGQSGPSNYQNVGATSAIHSIKHAVNEAMQQASVGRRRAEIAVVALAGVDCSKDERAAKDFVHKARIASQTFVVHDSIAYLQSAFPSQPGIVVESGAGCVAAGVNSKRRYVRVSGWGALFDDQGSGYDIGRKALSAAFCAVDGRGPYTRLVPAFKRRFLLSDLHNLVYIIHSKGLNVEEIASLAHLVSKEAPRDEVSRRILREAGTTLGELACVVAKRLKLDRSTVKVATVGGVFQAGKYLTMAFKQRVKQECPKAEIVRPNVEPAIGAFSIALQKANPKR